jgi:hypothetical protein
MGMFKDLRDIHKMSKQYERPKMGEAIGQMKDALQQHQQDAALAQHLVTNGVAGQATIKSLSYTGKEVNNMPELEMDLTVDVNGFQTEVSGHRQVVSPALLGSLQPGATVPCKADPQDNSKLFVGMQ